MIARIRKAMDENDEGFTLIELLVVIIIIGILAAIAIPVFLNQRKKAVDATMKADLKNAATTLETYVADNNTYPADGVDITAAANGGVKLSTGDVISYKLKADGNYCMVVSRAADAQPGNQKWVYESGLGGLQGKGVEACA